MNELNENQDDILKDKEKSIKQLKAQRDCMFTEIQMLKASK